jgi:hypothetical protein
LALQVNEGLDRDKLVKLHKLKGPVEAPELILEGVAGGHLLQMRIRLARQLGEHRRGQRYRRQ